MLGEIRCGFAKGSSRSGQNEESHVWNCTKCNEELEDSFGVCWNCGTARDGTEDPTFQPEEDVLSDAVETTSRPVTAEESRMVVHEQPCSFCGSKRLTQNVTISQTAEAGYTGLQYRTALVLVGSEPLLADLCVACGTVQRLHVKSTDREWITK